MGDHLGIPNSSDNDVGELSIGTTAGGTPSNSDNDAGELIDAAAVISGGSSKELVRSPS